MLRAKKSRFDKLGTRGRGVPSGKYILLLLIINNYLNSVGAQGGVS